MKTRRFLGLFLFLLVSLFAFGLNANVKAVETSADVFVEGAQVRTTGNAGLRFVATENVMARDKSAFGFVLAFGEAKADESFVIGGTVNGKEVVSAEVSETDEGTFMVTLYDIPESMYKQKVSARAYVIADDEYVYAEEVCVRSLADVVIAAYKAGDESEFVKTVYEALQPAGTTLYYNAEPQFESFDAFVEELVKDFDAADPNKVVTKETFAAQTGTAIKNVFNKVEMINKYRWLLEFVLESMTEKCGKKETYEDTYAQTVEMINKILNNDTAAISGSYANARTAVRQVIYALINKTNKGQNSAYDGYVADFTVASNYAAILPNVTASEVVELEENAVLPAELIIPYYTFVGWYDNSEFNGEAVMNHNGSEAYYAKFVPTTYTITYNLQGGATTAELVNEYTIETETFALPAASTMSIENGEFVGWYANATGSGAPVTEIAKGNAGNINLYAVWAIAAPTVVELTAADSAVINKYNPTKFVLASATPRNYEINGEIYQFGETVFASFSAALSASSNNDVIYVFAGEYEIPTNTTISKSLTILGPNADLGSQVQINSEAKLIFTANAEQGTSNTFNADNLVFNGLVISGTSATTGANYFYSGASLKNISFISCEITNMATFNRFQNESSSIVLTYENCNFNNIGQFIIWSYAGRVSTVNVKGCYFDGTSCGGVDNTAAGLFRIVSGNAYIYNNTFVGNTKETNGGYFCNRVEGNIFEVKYNTFKDVTKFICASSAKMHTFDCNLYLTGETAAETSPLAGNANATADTTVCSSAQDLAAKWAEFNK